MGYFAALLACCLVSLIHVPSGLPGPTFAAATGDASFDAGVGYLDVSFSSRHLSRVRKVADGCQPLNLTNIPAPLPEGCWYVSEGPTVTVTSDLNITGEAGADVILDMALLFYMMSLQPGVKVTLAGLSLENAVLFPPAPEDETVNFDTTNMLLPAFFHVADNQSSVIITGCTINVTSESCATLFAQIKSDVGTAVVSTNSLIIPSFQAVKVAYTNVTITCLQDFNTSPPPDPSLGLAPPSGNLYIQDKPLPTYIMSTEAANEEELIQGLLIQDDIGHPLLIKIEKDIIIDDRWPTGKGLTLTSSTFITGPLAGPRIWWNLDNNPHFMTLNSSSARITIANIGILNSCSVIQQLDPNFPEVRLVRPTPLGGVNFTRWGPDHINGISMHNVTFVTTIAEIKFYAYWSIAGESPFQGIKSLADFLSLLRGRGVALGREVSSKSVHVARLGALVYELLNVTLVTELPPGTPDDVVMSNKTIQCLTGEPVAPEVNSVVPLYFVEDQEGLLNAIEDVLQPNGSTSTSPYSPIFHISVNVSFGDLPQDSPDLDRNLLLTGTLGTAVRDGEVAEALPIVILDMAEVAARISVPESNVSVFIQRLTIINAVSLDPYEAAGRTPPDSYVARQTSLPLWAFSLASARSAFQLQVDDITMIVPMDEFLVLKTAAENGPPYDDEQIKIFEVANYSDTHVMFSNYLAWGLNATNLMVTHLDVFSPQGVDLPPPYEGGAQPPYEDALPPGQGPVPSPGPTVGPTPPSPLRPNPIVIQPPSPPTPPGFIALSSPPLLPQPAPPPESGGSDNSVAIGVGVTFGIVAMLSFAGVAWLCLRSRNQKRRSEKYSEMALPIYSGSPKAPHATKLPDGTVQSSSSATWTLE